MAADVPVGAQFAVLVADDEHRLRAGPRRRVAAGSTERGDVAGELPRALEDELLLGRLERRVEVCVRWQRDAFRRGRVGRTGGGG